MRANLVKGLLRCLAIFPLPILHGLGAILGWIFTLVPNAQLRVTEKNLALCFPNLDCLARKTLRDAAMIETGKTLIEIAALWHWPKERVLALVQQVHGLEQMDQAFQAHHGLIVVTPHLGAWEMFGLYCGQRYRLTSLYRRPRLQGLDTLIRNAREKTGAHLVSTDLRGIRHLYRSLARGEALGILPDQEPQVGSGTFAPFFSIPTYSTTLLPRLAAKTHAAVFFGYAHRLPKGKGYELHFLPANQEINNENLVQAAGAMNRMVQTCVERVPEQYQWSYKRFRTRPKGEAPIY